MRRLSRVIHRSLVFLFYISDAIFIIQHIILLALKNDVGEVEKVLSVVVNVNFCHKKKN